MVFMDPRYLELAKQLTQYSTSLKKGEKVLLDLVDTPEEMGLALIRRSETARPSRFYVWVLIVSTESS